MCNHIEERMTKDRCPMSGITVEQPMTWAEDKATVGTDLSADPGAKTERRAMDLSLARLSQIPFGIGIKAINPAGRSPATWNTETPGDGLPDVSNSDRLELRFTLNQYKSSVGGCEFFTHCNPKVAGDAPGTSGAVSRIWRLVCGSSVPIPTSPR